MATTQPVPLLTAWYKRDRRMFDRSMPPLVKKFFATPLPVRVWYNTRLAGEAGSAPSDSGAALANFGAAGGQMGSGGSMGSMGSMGSGGSLSSSSVNSVLANIPTFQSGEGGTLGTRLGLGAVHDLASVIIIVDLSRMEGLSLGQIADYIAMAALTNVDTNSSFGDLPSILALFSSSDPARPVASATGIKRI